MPGQSVWAAALTTLLPAVPSLEQVTGYTSPVHCATMSLSAAACPAQLAASTAATYSSPANFKHSSLPNSSLRVPVVDGVEVGVDIAVVVRVVVVSVVVTDVEADVVWEVVVVAVVVPVDVAVVVAVEVCVVVPVVDPVAVAVEVGDCVAFVDGDVVAVDVGVESEHALNVPSTNEETARLSVATTSAQSESEPIFTAPPIVQDTSKSGASAPA